MEDKSLNDILRTVDPSRKWYIPGILVPGQPNRSLVSDAIEEIFGLDWTQQNCELFISVRRLAFVFPPLLTELACQHWGACGRTSLG